MCLYGIARSLAGNLHSWFHVYFFLGRVRKIKGCKIDLLVVTDCVIEVQLLSPPYFLLQLFNGQKRHQLQFPCHPIIVDTNTPFLNWHTSFSSPPTSPRAHL